MPADAFFELDYPLGEGIGSAMGVLHGGLCALDQERSQVGVAMLGDRAQMGLPAAGMLLWRQAQPGAELWTIFELIEVDHRGGHGGGSDGSDAKE